MSTDTHEGTGTNPEGQPTGTAVHEGAPSNPEVRHETRDVYTGPILWFLLGLVVVALVIHGLIAWLLSGLAEGHRQAQPPRSPLAEQRPRFPENLGAIPEPRLQVTEVQDLQKLRDAEEAILTSYGWSDPDAGRVRIPIDRAMELLAERASSSGDFTPARKEERP